MIIVSQDKTENVNYNNVVSILSTNCEEDGYLISARIQKNDDCYIELGYYKTKERAKEVLEEIAKCYRITENYKIENENNREVISLNNNVLVYQMPEE